MGGKARKFSDSSLEKLFLVLYYLKYNFYSSQIDLFARYVYM
jgi:hypothetical protein